MKRMLVIKLCRHEYFALLINQCSVQKLISPIITSRLKSVLGAK